MVLIVEARDRPKYRMLNIACGFYHPKFGFDPIDTVPLDQTGSWLALAQIVLSTIARVRVNGELVRAAECLAIAAIDPKFTALDQ